MGDGRFVLDTNVLVSALLFATSLPFRALEQAEQSGLLVVSRETYAEFEEVILRERFDRYARRQRREVFLSALAKHAIWVDLLNRITACRDANDDKFLEVAINGNATCIVTGDADLLVLNPFRGIPILTPRDFLEVVR